MLRAPSKLHTEHLVISCVGEGEEGAGEEAVGISCGDVGGEIPSDELPLPLFLTCTVLGGLLLAQGDCVRLDDGPPQELLTTSRETTCKCVRAEQAKE